MLFRSQERVRPFPARKPTGSLILASVRAGLEPRRHRTRRRSSDKPNAFKELCEAVLQVSGRRRGTTNNVLDATFKRSAEPSGGAPLTIATTVHGTFPDLRYDWVGTSSLCALAQHPK